MDNTENTETEALLLEPRETYDQFIIGASFDGQFFVYDADRILQYLDDKWKDEEHYSPSDALEHFYHNMIGAYVGPGTPLYITKDYKSLFPHIEREHLPKTKEKTQ